MTVLQVLDIRVPKLKLERGIRVMVWTMRAKLPHNVQNEQESNPHLVPYGTGWFDSAVAI